MIEEDAAITGGFVGLNMGHDRNDLVRAVMEGITYNLRYALEILKRYDPDIHEMLMVGGGSKSPLWRQMFADVMRLDTIKNQHRSRRGLAGRNGVGTQRPRHSGRITAASTVARGRARCARPTRASTTRCTRRIAPSRHPLAVRKIAGEDVPPDEA